ncbi:hypothetical protein QBC32DRAFT_400155 [Pseudoneurospora amorphoporcata]|uniref:Uncharacterized protein n=1 Tax=Pseudoneurospora amorphoporcata TaxID=241081 RepID=A0AAN6NR05_9PEZI|nr:hypothetical protein QBC32DRAFT_400155 [Pseudoneurospora amorphoporcata]
MVNNVVDEDFRGHVPHSTEPRSCWRDMLPVQITFCYRPQTLTITLQSRLTLFSAFDGASGSSPILSRCCSVPSRPEQSGTESVTAYHSGYSIARIHRLSTDIRLVVPSTAASSCQEQLLRAWSCFLGRTDRASRGYSFLRAFHFLLVLSARVILALSILEQLVDALHQNECLVGDSPDSRRLVEAHCPNLAKAAG